MLGSVALEAAVPFGSTGLFLALLGMLFALSGAAIETCLANAYSVSQFFGWRWGRHRPPKEAPRFTLCWIAVFAVALALVLIGLQPLQLAEYAVISSILVLPLTYLPLLLLAGDHRFMRRHANGVVSKVLGWGYYALIVAAALAALPLYLLTSGGKS
jgi:Mn2+/Fe2+ NRAMP family transporter